jgi:acyl-CoA synthetase (AMP-forming)/AMP-acid ligase II/acyl carrier protein
MTMQTALNILLHKYTGQEDIVIGSPIAGREHPDLEGQIGFYVNTLALRNQFSKEDTVTELYQKIKQNTLGAYSHQVYPYDELVDTLQLTRDMSRNPLFDVMLVVQSSDESETGLGFLNTKIHPYHSTLESYEVAKFDLSFGFEEHSEGMYYSLNYNTDIYSEEHVNRMLSHLKHLLRTISSQKQTAITEYDILTKEEKTYLLETLNDTQVDYPKDKTLVDLFEDQEEKTPDAVAIKFKDIELTYRELNEKSNQLAHYLIKNYNIQPDDLVGIELERSEWMVIGILAIIKSGGAYVPIDPEYPEQRKSFIKDDASFKVTINEHELEKFRAAYNNNNKEYLSTNPNIKLSPNNLMYVIYTSGSTGNPKGVLVEHGSCVNITKAYFGSKLKCALTCNYNFDVSVLEIFSSLISGAELYIPELDIVSDVDQYLLFLERNNIDTVYLHPFWIEDFRLFPYAIKNVLTGVEPVYYHALSTLFTDSRTVINGYGPTETTICSTFFKLQRLENNGSKLPIGKPLPNTETYLLDSTNRLVPYGSIGEICIGGVGLARGYLNRDELTKEKFIENPYNPTERLYRTGDLGRWREDGNLEYLGRIDDQVKIRGYRIELGEIEQSISSHESSGQVVVIARAISNTGEKELIAYTTGEVTADELKSYLKEKLPSYMVPNYYVRLDSIPLTSNGKVDRKSLPDPEGTGISQGDYVAPRTTTEKQLVKIWSDVLRSKEEEIGLESDFFALGGDSIKAIRLIHLVDKELNSKVQIAHLLQNNILRDFVKMVEINKNNSEKKFKKSIEL